MKSRMKKWTWDNIFKAYDKADSERSFSGPCPSCGKGGDDGDPDAIVAMGLSFAQLDRLTTIFDQNYESTFIGDSTFDDWVGFDCGFYEEGTVMDINAVLIVTGKR